MKLSQSIRRAMAQQGLGPNDFHRVAGVARSTLFNLLADKTPEPDLGTLKKLRAAGVRIPRDILGA